MGKQLDLDSLDALIIAVREYQEDLDRNRLILANAANACDAAMGNDAIAQKYIDRLENALKSLSSASSKAASVAQALIQDKMNALDVLYNN